MKTARAPLRSNEQLYAAGMAMTLDELALHKVDARFASHIQRRLHEQVRAVRWLMADAEPFATATDGEYTVHIMTDTCILFLRRDIATPAPTGRWMGFWDPDLAPFATKAQYDLASLQQQAQWDAQVQLTKYARDQFAINHAEFWCSGAYDRWWWDQGGAEMTMKRPDTAKADFLQRVAVAPVSRKEA